MSGRAAHSSGFRSGASQTKPSGSVKGPTGLTSVMRWEPPPSTGTPATFASAFRLYRDSLMLPGSPANSTYLPPKLLPTVSPRST